MVPGRSTPRLIALEGPSGVGKSRLAELLVERIPEARGLPEAFDRLLRPPSLEVPDRAELLQVERRLFREELRRYRSARDLLTEGHPVIADTGFLGPLTYSIGLARLDPERDVAAVLWGATARAAGLRTLGIPDLTLRLNAPAPTVRRRVLGDPGRHPRDLAARHRAVYRIEALLWDGPIARLLGRRYAPLDARGSEDRVLARALARIARTGAELPLRAPEASKLLGEVAGALEAPSATVKKWGRRAPTPRR